MRLLFLGLLALTLSAQSVIRNSTTNPLPNNQVLVGAGLQTAKPGNLTGDVTTNNNNVVTVTNINGTSLPASNAANLVLLTTAPSVAIWDPVPACVDAGGQHLNYNTTTHLFSCGVTSGTVASVSFATITSGINTAADMNCGTGCSLEPSGAGTVTANQITLTGDVTSNNNLITTLATVNSSPGLCGDSTDVCQITTNGKGLVTLQAPVAIGACANCATGTGNFTNGQLIVGAGAKGLQVGDLTGDVITSGSTATTDLKIHGTSVPVNTLADQALITTASAVGAWTSFPSCLDTGGNHLNYSTSTHLLSCGNTSSAAGGTITGSGTLNVIPKFTSSSAIGNSSSTDDGTTITLGLQTSLGTNSLMTSYANANPGTVVNTLTKINSSGQALQTTTGDINNIFGICIVGCGNSATSSVAFAGQASCKFDGTTVVRDFVGASPTVSGDCHDFGSAEPTGVQVIGRVGSVNTGAGTNASVILFAPDTVNGATPSIHSIMFSIDGGGTTIGTGSIGQFPSANFACTITSAMVSADQSGSVSIDVWKTNAAIPNSGNKISASAPMALTSAQLNQAASSLSGWTLSVVPNDVFGFNVVSATSVTKITGQLWCQ